MALSIWISPGIFNLLVSNNSSSEKADIFDLADRLVNSFSYRMSSLVSGRRRNRDYNRYKRSGEQPLTPGYHVYKWAQVTKALGDCALLDVFKRALPLPANYGYGIDERIVEYPWLISRLPETGGTFLDAGSALNFSMLIKLPVLKEKTVHIVTLHPEGNCFWQEGVSYEFADLRDLPLRDNYFDQIACISTLEHVGLNTEIYTSARVELLQKGDYKLAASELWRVLKPGGHLYLTMPFGKACNLDWLQQFDSRMIADLIEFIRPQKASAVYYRYEATGWNVANADACRDSAYTPPEFWSMPVQRIAQGTPVAAGAVVCLDLLK
jgi:SAM-dependent methyltransferase